MQVPERIGSPERDRSFTWAQQGMAGARPGELALRIRLMYITGLRVENGQASGLGGVPDPVFDFIETLLAHGDATLVQIGASILLMALLEWRNPGGGQGVAAP